MRVLITGSEGLIGRVVATHLQSCGWDVRLIDIASSIEHSADSFVACNIMDFDAIRAQMQGCDAVVHLAALRNPYYGPGEEVFRINTVGTFNVFEAAAKEGIRRVVQASSINAIGCAWNTGDFAPHYLPVDENHPLFTTDYYSFSKQQAEEIGAYFWRRDGISSIALRLPGIYPADGRNSPQAIERRDNMRRYLDTFVKLPPAQQQQLLTEVRQQCLSFRAARHLEYPTQSGSVPPPEGIDIHLWHAYTFDRFNLWAALDVRDAALAIEKSLTTDFEGSHNLFVSNTHNSLGYDSATLAQLFFPHVTQFKRPLVGSESLVDVSRARELIGFEPQQAS